MTLSVSLSARSLTDSRNTEVPAAGKVEVARCPFSVGAAVEVLLRANDAVLAR